ncbi:MAG: DUF4373 domain-containing protein [Eubacterium sp.]|nr:DUF4373 domain-containing protein [Eubacterium sp.]
MARPIKEGLDYFPLNTVFSTEFKLLRAEFGAKGITVLIVIMMLIHREHGYYCEWREDICLTVAEDCGFGVNSSFVSEIAGACLRREVFNEEMYKKYNILTSAKIQKVYLAAKRNDFSKISERYLLLSAPKNRVNAEKTGVIATKTGVNATKTLQNKINRNISNNINNKDIYNKLINKPTNIREEVCSAVEYNTLKKRVGTSSGREVIDNIIDIIVEVLTGERTYYQINKERVGAGAVKARFQKLRLEHIEYTVRAIENCEGEIKNMRGYVISVLYNSYSNISLNDLYGSNR